MGEIWGNLNSLCFQFYSFSLCIWNVHCCLYYVSLPISPNCLLKISFNSLKAILKMHDFFDCSAWIFWWIFSGLLFIFLSFSKQYYIVQVSVPSWLKQDNPRLKTDSRLFFCVILSEFLNLSSPQFSHVWNGDDYSTSSTYSCGIVSNYYIY